MLPLAHYSKSRFFQCTHGVEMTYAGNLRQGLDDYLYFTHIRASELLVNHVQIIADRIFDVF